MCPRGQAGAAHYAHPTGAFTGFWAVEDLRNPPAPKAAGPIADIPFFNAVDTTAFATMLTETPAETPQDGAPAETVAPLPRINMHPPFHVPELVQPYQQTSFFRDPYPAQSSPGPNLL